ncbi:hypothetical protein OG689_34810 [Kitasatospora sp. NBC_00240]|uniref:hypothetical protein n=1 Tax=Kitasatospora sp. NBC_00240 TaxID=2903567 RepID=UPI0022506C95|nr:hypothetical protein [Kitasatospora sp. NBC_00240]MCX5214374.1 hypothetical protein [Kitasatospora sp. NBC_00240]
MKGINATVSVLACLMGLSGCVMSDPDGFVFGFRVVEGQVEVFLPMCPDDRLESIRAADASGERVELFTAAHPTAIQAGNGNLIIHDTRGWAPEGFEDRQVFNPAAGIPRLLSVRYRHTDGEASGDVADMDKVTAAALEPDQYWTDKGPMTAEQISRQFHCNKPTS